MQPQKLCLKWNNHTANLLSVLGGFRQRDILVDVTISCEGQNIKAHKMVLSACSPYFQNIFLENPCQHPVVIINGMKYEDITAILNFMYKGEVNVSQDGLTSFLQAAEALKVKGLAEVCGEKKSTNSSSQEVPQSEQPPPQQQQQQQQQNRPQRTDTPPRKRNRNRKRSLSDSNRSDDEGSSRKQHREPSSPEIHELSGDESFTGDTNSNGPPFNNTPRVPQNVYSRSHQSSSNLDDDDEFEVEPSKLLEQTLTTENVSMNNSSIENKLRIERIMGNTEIESSSLQEPESPPDIKPIIDYGDSSAGPSEGSMMLYNEQSQPGPSSLQDGSLLHDNAHAQGGGKKEESKSMTIKRLFQKRDGVVFSCPVCKFSTNKSSVMEEHCLKYSHASSKTTEDVTSENKDATQTALFQRMFKYMEELNSKMNALTEKVDHLMEQITTKTLEDTALDFLPCGATDGMELPITTEEQLKDFNEKLKEDRELSAVMVRYLHGVGNGKKPSTFVLSLAKKILSQDLAMQFSRYGRKGKKSFLPFNETMTVILAAAAMKFKDTDKEKLSEMFGKALASAPEWNGRRIRPSENSLSFE